jgi:eukaryotic-like serine/threonine-protein kinase
LPENFAQGVEDVAMTEETLFELALNTPPAERSALLERACKSDADLLARLKRLLAAHEQSHAAVDAHPDLVAATTDAADAPANGIVPAQTSTLGGETAGATLGRYTLEKLLGEGGMGDVWVARQSEPVKRRVALKLIKTGMDSRSVLQRFDAERQALAVMDHPNIAKVFDGGLLPDGRPFFAMELVNGLPINKFCDDARIGTRERLELFVKVCQAVQHAHQKGIIHRDLKPANVLVTMIDGAPEPKVIDFGVAKAMGGRLNDATETTEFGAIVGTLEYMAPEQAGYSGTDVDTRADVYALGVILYELLTGLRPFDSQRLRQAALDEMIRIIREEEPSKPSTRLSSSESLPSSAAARHCEPKRLIGSLRGDLDWIVMKCLEKDRNRRYETANGLAADLMRHLADEPVSAGPPSASYRFRKWARRHRKGVAVALFIWVVTAAHGGFATLQYWKAEDARKTAVAAQQAESEQRLAAVDANRRTFRALESFTDDLMEKLFSSRTERTDAEKLVLRNALEQWEAFARSQGSSPDARRIQAGGAMRVAAVQRKLGMHEDAEQNLRAAIELRQALAAELPDDAENRSELAAALNNLGLVLLSFGKLTDAEEPLREAVKIRAAFAEQFPEDPTHRIYLARSRNNLGNLFDDRREWSAAEREYRLALAIQETLPDRTPEQRAATAFLHHNLGMVLKNVGRESEVAPHFEAALAIKQGLTRDFPEVDSYRADLARSENAFGLELFGMGRRVEAETHYRNALAIQEKLVAEFPAVPGHRLEWGGSCCNFGILLSSGGRHTESLPWFDKAVSALTPLHEQPKPLASAGEFLGKSHRGRALALFKLRRHDEAARDFDRAQALLPTERDVAAVFRRATSRAYAGLTKEAAADLEELQRQGPANGDQWYALACLYAILSEKSAEGKKDFADRAMELLNKAVTEGFLDADHMAKDADLAPLRDRGDFKVLLAELSAAASGTPKPTPASKSVKQ